VAILQNLTSNSPESQPYLVDSCDTAGEPKTGDKMFEIMMKSKTMIEDDYGINIIGWCSDNGLNSKNGCHLMSEVFLWMIILVCWVHQINIIVGDLLGLKHEVIEVIELALNIICWFNNHSEPLG